MKSYVLGLTLSFIALGCNGQEGTKGDIVEKKDTVKIEHPNKPEVSWKVNKQTDEYGNVIRYDSIYSWSYSNKEGQAIQIDVDSLMRSFDGFMSDRFPGFWHDRGLSPFKTDSLWRQDFWEEDFFMDRWRRDYYDLNPMFRRMDSLRNHFLRKHVPEWDHQENEGQKI